MEIRDAQREIRTHFIGGSYGQLVSGTIWLASASLATWMSAAAGITTLVVGGMFIFPLTQLLVRIENRGTSISRENALNQLGMQVAFVLPLSMPLLVAVVRYRPEWFYPAMMILVGAHYLPFVFLYGMRMFFALAIALLVSGMLVAMYGATNFVMGGWIAGVTLVVFGIAGRVLVARDA